MAHAQRKDWRLSKASLLPDLEMAGRAEFQPCCSRFRRGMLQPGYIRILIRMRFLYTVKECFS